MESANREEAERALDKAKKAFKNGDIDSAYKFVLKSLKLCSTQEGKGLFINLFYVLPLHNLSDLLVHFEKNKGKVNNHETCHKKISSDNKSGEKLQSDDVSGCKHDYTPEQVEAVQR